MKTHLRFLISMAALVSSAFALALQAEPQGSPVAREDAYRANNVGVALLEQFKYKEATEQFQRALKIEPALGVARVNLAIALYNDQELAGAAREARAAVPLLPNAPQPHYVLGLIAKAQNRTEDAIAAFSRVLEIDKRDVGANVNLGQLLMRQNKHADAIALFRTAIAAEPYNVSAAYNLALALLRTNEREEGQQMMQRFQSLRASGYGTTIGQNYLEQGRYAEAITSTGAEPELVEASLPAVTFTNATAALLASPAQKSADKASPSLFGRALKAEDLTEAGKRELVAALGGGVTLFDYDADGDLDLLDVGPWALRLYRNDGGKLIDATQGAGLGGADAKAVAIGAVAGDYDNDARPDLFVLRYGGNALYRNEGNGRFSDATAAAGLPAYAGLAVSAAFLDIDHDGDLDIFIAGLADLARPAGAASAEPVFPTGFAAAPNLLLRNNGNGKFSDVTAEAKLSLPTGHAVAIVPTDYDNRRDIDLLIVNYGEGPTLFSNLRDGTFRNVAAEAGLGARGNFTSAAAGDVNKDGFTDFFFGRADGPGVVAMSDGQGRFASSPAPAGMEAITAAQFLDYDNDGLLDIVALSSAGARAMRNIGGKWSDVTDRAAVKEILSASAQGEASPRAFAAGDLDQDGDTDLILRAGASGLRIARNEGASANRSLRMQLAGKVSNRSGVGAKVEVRAGSLKQKLETYAASPAPAPADIVFGLGKRAGADAVRVLWPAGIVQAETEIAARDARATASFVSVVELDRKPSSCPYLYTWNGEAFEFVTDFLGGGEMGYLHAPGVRSVPDPDEYVRISEERLKARDGRYEIRITNELEEVLYLDRLQLIAIAHPAGVEVFPNEGLTSPPHPPFKLYTARDARAPLSAVDDHGRDVSARIARIDRQYPDDFKLRPIRGYAEKHALALDLGEDRAERPLLLLTGWTDYAFSSDNLAAHQGGLKLSPPELQVKDRNGDWQTVIPEIGIPVGRPQTIVVDLTGKLLTTSREVRIVTNMRIYWDQILVASNESAPTRMARLEPLTAGLRWRGFSAEVTPDGREPFGYDYNRVAATSPWKVMPGRYTREGDVRPLLARVDDMFVVSRPGDELAISFDATRLARLPAGWKRTFLLYADGFTKEMDINSASPDQVAPLPFHAMKSYPYSAPESYPTTRAHRDYVERYNTRVVAASVPPIETVFAEKVTSTARAKGGKKQ
jgi:tetratricopeptide (TPR) repeat protein